MITSEHNCKGMGKRMEAFHTNHSRCRKGKLERTGYFNFYPPLHWAPSSFQGTVPWCSLSSWQDKSSLGSLCLPVGTRAQGCGEDLPPGTPSWAPEQMKEGRVAALQWLLQVNLGVFHLYKNVQLAVKVLVIIRDFVSKCSTYGWSL